MASKPDIHSTTRRRLLEAAAHDGSSDSDHAEHLQRLARSLDYELSFGQAMDLMAWSQLPPAAGEWAPDYASDPARDNTPQGWRR